MRKQLSGIKGIQSVSFSSNTPVEDDNDNWTTFKFNHAIKETDFYAINKWTDNEYVPTYKLPLVAGRNLQASDTAREFLVNEILIKNLGIINPQDALNKEIDLWDGQIKGNIVGVLKDFNDRSFRRDLAPVLMTTMKRGYSVAGIKLATQDVPSAMKSIEKYGTKHSRILFLNTNSLMQKLRIFINRKTSYRNYIKYLPRSLYSSVVLAYMDWLLSWLYNALKK